MFNFGVITLCLYFTPFTIWNAAFAAPDPIIRTVELSSFGSNLEQISTISSAAWPVVGKCCPVGMVHHTTYENENGTDAETGNGGGCIKPPANEIVKYSPYFYSLNNSKALNPGGEKLQFIAVVGNPCNEDDMYMLEPEKDSLDEYYLLENGSIIVPSNPTLLEPGRDYCMENVFGEEDIRVLVCLPADLIVYTADTRFAFYAVGLLTSVPFLIATIIAYSITHQLRDTYGLALCCYAGCLALAFLTLAISQLTSKFSDNEQGNGIAFVIQFSFIACFLWLNAMTFEMLRLIKRYGRIYDAIRDERPESNRTFLYYSLWGWGVTAILIVIWFARDLPPIIPWTYLKRPGDNSPSFSVNRSAVPYFYVPVGLLVFANAIIFTITGIEMRKTQRKLDIHRLAHGAESGRQARRVFKELKLIFVVTLVLYLIMGINWTMELVSLLTGSDLMAWSIFDLINALQGLLVFGLFVLRKPARTFVWNRIRIIIGKAPDDSENQGINEDTLLPIVNNNSTNPRTLYQ